MKLVKRGSPSLKWSAIGVGTAAVRRAPSSEPAKVQFVTADRNPAQRRLGGIVGVAIRLGLGDEPHRDGCAWPRIELVVAAAGVGRPDPQVPRPRGQIGEG
jgi:hypothetical protein